MNVEILLSQEEIVGYLSPEQRHGLLPVTGCSGADAAVVAVRVGCFGTESHSGRGRDGPLVGVLQTGREGPHPTRALS